MGSAVSSAPSTPIDITQAKEFAGCLWSDEMEAKFRAAAGDGTTVSLGDLMVAAPELFKAKNLLIIGAGPGISGAVARKFGNQGYKVSLVSITIEDAENEVAMLKQNGIAAFSFACDVKVCHMQQPHTLW
jgi:hypothetical protein